MAVEKMHFSMPMATGFEAFPFTPFQVEQESPRAEQESFTPVKARAEQEAPILKAKVKKAKPVVKVKVEKAKVEKAKPEEATIKSKAELEVEVYTTEEGLSKFLVLLDKEAAFLRAKAEAEKEAGCGSKRKPVLERDEEGAAFVARMEALRPLYGEEDVSDGYYSQDDDPDTTFDDVMAQMEQQIQANNARWPFLVGA